MKKNIFKLTLIVVLLQLVSTSVLHAAFSENDCKNAELTWTPGKKGKAGFCS